MVLNVSGKVCVVFGGLRGIGRVVSKLFVSCGGIVVVLFRDSDCVVGCVNWL